MLQYYLIVMKGITIEFIIQAMDGQEGLLWYLLTTGVLLAVILHIVLFLLQLFFERRKRNNKSIHLTFFERLTKVIAVVCAFLILLFGYIGTGSLWRTLFGSTVLVGGIIGIAGQDIIKDILGGLMLSFYKPFDLGDRLYLNDIPRSVIVEDMTMRHVVLRARDGMRFIIPNSEINKQTITHSNFDHKNRATYIYVPVSYGADLRKVIKLMRQAIKECPYTSPNIPANKDLDGYGDAYFVSIGENAMMMEMTIWSEPGMDNDFVVSEAYQSIIRLFAQNDIEIPYNHMNLIERQRDMLFYDEDQDNVPIRDISSRTDTVRVLGSLEESVIVVVDEVTKFCEFHGLKPNEQSQIELLSEELLTFMDGIAGEARGRFWIVGNNKKVSIHMRSTMAKSFENHKELVNLASDGKNSLMIGLVGRVHDMISRGMSEIDGVSFSLKHDTKLRDKDDFEKMLITKLADDVQVSALGDKVEVIVIKKFG